MGLTNNWNKIEENGLRVERSEVDPIIDVSSILFESLTTEFDVGGEGFRKSGSIALKPNFFERGFARAKIRTLWRRNTISVDQAEGWAGIYIMSDIENIGVRLDPMTEGYQITDKDGTIRILKFVNTLPTVIFDTGVAFPTGVVKSLEVIWEFRQSPDKTIITIKQGDITFINLVTIGTFEDTTNPIQFSESEGLFTQTLSHDHVVSYSFDSTSVTNVTKI